MSKNVNEVVSYFEKLYINKAIYLWGANSEVILMADVDFPLNTKQAVFFGIEEILPLAVHLL